MLEVIFSFDDGHKLDLKVAELLKAYKMPGIFFIPNTCQLTEEEISSIAKDFEIGGHTYSHPEDIKRLPQELIEIEVGDNKDWLENFTNYKLRWFAYPSGRHNEIVRQVVKDAGFKFARTTLVNCSKQLSEQDPFKIETTIHFRDDRKEYYGRTWLNQARDFINTAITENKKVNYLFHFFGHSLEIEKNNSWDELEILLKDLKYLAENNKLKKYKILTNSND